jgi:hypothetical protein
MECLQCHGEIEDSSRFCRWCGFMVADSSAGAHATPQSAPGPSENNNCGIDTAIVPLQQGTASAVPLGITAPPMHPVYPPSVTVQYAGRVELGAPIPSTEQVLWQGRQSFWFYVPKIAWSATWVVLWMYLASSMAQQLSRFDSIQSSDVQKILKAAEPVVASYSWVLNGFALLAFWGIVRSLLSYWNARFEVTTQRVRVRIGLLSQTITQIELFRLKDVALQASLWGRLCNYAHILLISSDRLMSHPILQGIPNGTVIIETIRLAAQQARSQSGVVSITE